MQKTCLDSQCFTVRVVRCVKWTSGPDLFNLLRNSTDDIYRLHREERKCKHTGKQGSNSNISTNSGNSLKQSGGHLRGKNALGNSSSSTNTRWGTSINKCKHWEFVVDHRLNKSDKIDITEKRQALHWDA